MTRDDDEREDNSPPLGSLIAHFPAIIREKWVLIVCPAVFFMCIGIAAAFILPEVYRSSAVLLVESPELSGDVLGLDADRVDRRIEIVRQQILSRSRLVELVEKHDLYPDKRKDAYLTDAVEEMRQAIRMETVSRIDQRSAREGSSTMTIELGFDYGEAAKAQAVMQDITGQILTFDASQSSEQASNTVEFLTEQAASIQSQMDEVAAEIRSITVSNGLSLSSPGMLSLNDSSGSYDIQIIALQRDNSLLRAQRAAEQTSAERDPIVSAAEADLAAAQAKYTDNHPDIALARRRLKEARQLAANKQEQLPNDTIDQQIAANDAQIDALRSMKAQEASRRNRAQSAMARSPFIQEQIAQKQQRLELFNRQYEAVTERLRQAQATAKAESAQMGERLSVIEAPSFPRAPISPNRPLFIAGGLAAGLGLGLFLVLALELFLRPIRDPDDILAVTGVAALGSIPTIRSEGEDETKSWLSRQSLGRFARR
ncbi:Wzz/FepE/Etk N-terminal domain-containing protein [Erythrobacter sp. T5W1-R]|uniref:GumC family protein n=1 Tax=Erythrobacter sp. T5W1-R TaxID=3101752 RepID=UPI002AFF1118|nr:Wzz/FepE/Etk N-terminal domain-containing protein [Erythrobacter sp. T5W1-R]MEA1620043.1 Wzz/FepE/Etk N-terminal domain-containing protein [Erythrobacter sp. T5W1-R]